MFEKKIKVLHSIYCSYCGARVTASVVMMKEPRFNKMIEFDKTNNYFVKDKTTHDAVIETDNGICRTCKSASIRSAIFI